jgi:hypothetical protein
MFEHTFIDLDVLTLPVEIDSPPLHTTTGPAQDERPPQPQSQEPLTNAY